MTWAELIPVTLLACAESRPVITASRAGDYSDHIAANNRAESPYTGEEHFGINDTARDEDKS